MTCFCSLLLQHSRDVAPLVWATGGGNTGTCAVPDEVRALDRVASPRPILASPRERELRQRTRHTPLDRRCGACDRHPRSHCCRLYFFIDSNQLLGYDAVREVFFYRKRQINTTTRQKNQNSDPYDGPGVPPLGLGLGIWFLVILLCGIWCWYFLGLGLGSGI